MNTTTMQDETVASSDPRHQIRETLSPPEEPSRRVHLEMTEEGAAVLLFDHPGKSANIFDLDTLEELEEHLDHLAPSLARGVVFFSAKPRIFLAGADLTMLSGARASELRSLIERGQRVFGKIAALEMPTVAAIHGACLGGGLELALACDCRLVSPDKVTKIGLPETQLGILPAWGGSTRLPRLLGLPAALGIILGGKPLPAKRARKLGLVDAVVPKERLREAALAALDEPVPRRKSRFLTNNPLSASLIRCLTKRKVLAKTRGHYPAQERALEVVTRAGSGREADSLRREVDAILDLAGTESTRNLLRLFHLQDFAKKFRFDASLDPAELAPIERSAVIGAGVMGSGIAQWFAARGLPVILQDISPEAVASGVASVRRLFDQAVKRHIFTPHEAERALDLVAPAHRPVPLERCDLVVEAAVEDLEVKKKIFADLCGRVRDDAILATNTSALPIGELGGADGVTHPERIAGLHFFNPVSRMKLVEVVVAPRTSPETVERLLRFVRGIGKLPVVVKDSPGFLVNRVLMPYLVEAGRLVERGHSPARIDRALVDFGMPMGPLRLLDEVGLDVALHVAGTLSASFGERFVIPPVLEDLVEKGHLGRKSGRGFYDYESGKTRPADLGTGPVREQLSEAEIAERLVGLMVEEAERCLEEGIVKSRDEIDLAMILGTGFPPFRGGPMAYGEAV